MPTAPEDHDLEVQSLVRDELEWTPQVDAADIGVSVVDSAVILSGTVSTYAQKVAAKKAALRVRGVRTLVDELTVQSDGRAAEVTETELAQEVERALKRSDNVPETVKAAVHGHGVMLMGEVTWDFERQAAVHAIESLRGVQSISNGITLRPRPPAADAEQRIREALARYDGVGPDTVDVVVDGTRATLTGTVKSWAQRRMASTITWSSPHITEVDNRIAVTA